MTFAQIQSNVLDRYNLTSADATQRVGQSINEYHRRVCSSLGLELTQRTTTTATTTPNNRLLVWGLATGSVPVEKVIGIQNPAFTPPQVLVEASVQELRDDLAVTDPPQRYAIFSVTSNSVTTFFDSTISTAFVLNADVLANMATLSGSMTPVFAEDFHDILEIAASIIELRKLEKYDMAKEMKTELAERISDLRFYYMKSAYMDYYQGKTGEVNEVRTVPLV